MKARFLRLVERAKQAEAEKGVTGLANAVADGYFKLLSYKDEYEVARLHLSHLDQIIAKEFSSVRRVTFHLAPPLFSGTGEDGRPKKRAFGPWIRHVFWILTMMKGLRGTPFDPFGHTAERRFERRLILDYEIDMERAIALVSRQNVEKVIELARVPEMIRGFGLVKVGNAKRGIASRARILVSLGLS